LTRGVADNIAIDDIADTAKDLACRREQHPGIQQDQGIDMFGARAPDQRGNNEEDGPVEGHPALPGRNNMDRIRQVVRNKVGLLNHEVEPPTYKARRNGPP
jgi:hypothetical protein